jgi:hypothetical protein
MSTLKKPVGRQSSSVYWRRRLMVGFGLLAVLVIIFLIIVKPGSSSGEPGGARKPVASSAATDAPSKQAAAPKPALDGACDAANVQVEAITDAVKYEPGQLPKLSLSITNTGSTACAINAGTSKQVFTVTSGKDVYWTSSDCQTDPADAQVTLKPGVPISSAEPVAWDRTRSAKDTCDAATRDAAPAGGASYFLTVTVDGIASSTPKQFMLY